MFTFIGKMIRTIMYFTFTVFTLFGMLVVANIVYAAYLIN